jgi:hypothetical protein
MAKITCKRPLRTLTPDEQNETAMQLWEAESMGGIMENNNRLPMPVVYLLVLTIVSSFLLTFPLWGQRPTAAIYEEYVALMDTPEVQALANDVERMDYIVKTVEAAGSKHAQEQKRHPVSMDDLRVMQPVIADLKAKGVRLGEYTVLGNKMVLANFEGNQRAANADGTTDRTQPWWDNGYLINIFYIVYFCLAVAIVVKRLPPYSVQPVHGNEHENWDDDIKPGMAASMGNNNDLYRKVRA